MPKGIFLRRIGSLLLWVWSGIALPGSVEFYAYVSSNEVSVGDVFTLTIKSNGNVSDFEPPEIPEGLVVISGPNQSSSISWINGVVSMEWSVSYRIRAVQEGTYTIGSATGVIDGKRYRTEPITIKVVKGNGGVASRGSGGGGGTPPTSPQKQQEQNEKFKGDVYISAVVSKNTVYPGEPFVITYYLYTRYNLASLQIDKMPGIENAWTEEIELSQNIQLKPTVVNGREFYYAPIRKVVVYPKGVGKVVCKPLSLRVVARIPMRREPQSLFDIVFGTLYYENMELPLKSNEVVVEVKDFPEKPPLDFSGFTGNLALNWSISSDTPMVNDAVTLRFTLSGRGNLKTVGIPAISFPAFVESYQPKTSQNTKLEEEGYVGSKTWEYVFIPRQAGEFKLDSFSISYFNLARKKFERVVFPGVVVRVRGGAPGVPSGVVAASPVSTGEKVRYIASDIRDIKRRREGDKIIAVIPENGIIFVTSFLPFLLSFMVVFVARRKRSMTHKEVVEKQFRETMRGIEKGLKMCRRNARREGLTLLQNAIFKYFANAYGISPQLITTSWIKEMLASHQIDEKTISDFINGLQTIDMELYASGVSLVSNDSLINIIANIKDSLKKIHKATLQSVKEKSSA